MRISRHKSTAQWRAISQTDRQSSRVNLETKTPSQKQLLPCQYSTQIPDKLVFPLALAYRREKAYDAK